MRSLVLVVERLLERLQSNDCFSIRPPETDEYTLDSLLETKIGSFHALKLQINTSSKKISCAHCRRDAARVIGVDPEHCEHLRLDAAWGEPMVPDKHLHHLYTAHQRSPVCMNGRADLCDGGLVVYVGHGQEDEVLRLLGETLGARRDLDLICGRRRERPRHEGGYSCAPESVIHPCRPSGGAD